MVDRTATVLVRAPAGPYIADTAKMSAATTGMARTIQTSTASATTGMTKLGQATGALPAKFGALTQVGGGAFAAVGLGAAFAVKKFADFDVAMDAVGASTGATGAELKQLGDTALEAAAATKFGATDAARGMEALAKAGVSTADIVGGGLKGALDLAAAGEVEVAEAAETAASAMTQFGLVGQDVPHIADLLAAAAGKAQGSVSDMSLALKQSGLVASQMGLSIEETTGTLAAFASAGLTSSDAGTSFRTMLLRLANPTGKAAELMNELGIAAYDAQGNFVGIEALAGVLQDRLSTLTQEQRNAALAIIFGQDAIRGANVLYAEGADGIAEWTANVDDAGFAAEQAAARTDNLMGDLERLGGEVEALSIKLGGSADGPLRDFVQGLEDMATEVSEEVDLWRNQYLPAIGDVDQWIDEHLIPDFLELPDLIKGSTEETEKQADASARAASELEREAAMVDRFSSAAEVSADQTAALAEEMATLRDEAIKGTEAFLASRDAQRGFEQAVDDARAAVKENGETLDINTQKGRDNEAALDDVAAAALKVMESVEFVTASEEDQNRMSKDMRTELVRAGRRFGLTKEEANAYADEILNIPTAPTTKPKFIDKDAREKITAFQTLLSDLPSSIPITIRAPTGGFGGFFTAGPTKAGGLPFLGSYPITQGPHDGGALDYGMPVGTPLRATFPGYLDVTDLGNRSYGKYYTLRGAGRYELGAHLSAFARNDGLVPTGALIGWSGSTGNSTGPHLHLLRNFHQGGWTQGGPINTLRGEYVVNPGASAQWGPLLQAINAGRVGNDGPAALRLHPQDINAVGRVIAKEIITAVGAGAYTAGQRTDLYSRTG